MEPSLSIAAEVEEGEEEEEEEVKDKRKETGALGVRRGDGFLVPYRCRRPETGRGGALPLRSSRLDGRSGPSLAEPFDHTRQDGKSTWDARPGAMSWDQRTAISSEIDSAIRGIISSGSALLASCRQGLGQSPSLPSGLKSTAIPVPPPPQVGGETVRTGGNLDIVEIDAVELLAEHVHFCDICGKGFKRDANLRMHMRAHGNQYKTQEALAKPGRVAVTSAPVEAGKVRFSCPFAGCSRNQRHPRFRPLKSAICVKNHFKRSHCPKMYSCNKCNRKTFSVLADLKSHLKHCGQTRWACSCGTTFSRKDKLFGHMALFEGHMPAVEERKEDVKKEEQQQSEAEASVSGIIGGLTEEELGAIDQRYFESLGDDFFGSELEMGLEFSDMVPVDDAFRELL